MDSATRLTKTDKGKQEIDHRQHKLPARLRTLLILVDGTRSVTELADDGRKLGAPDDGLIVLMTGGFIAPISGPNSPAAANDPSVAVEEPRAGDEYERFRIAKQFMNETAVDNLGGLKKFTFTLRLEKCSVRKDLNELMGDYELALTKSIGGDAASVLVKRMKVLLA
jgi:hypothetical protein